MDMRKDILVYLSGPITAKHHTVEENTASAIKVYFDLLSRGVPAFCPHLSAAFPSAFTVPYDVWLAYDYAVIDRCTHMLMLPGWADSNGALLEARYAQYERQMPIAYSVDEFLGLLK